MNKPSLFAAALLMAAGISAHAANIDELWEVANVMEMDGMTIPSTTQKTCIPKNQAYKPESEDKNCTTYDVKVSGNKSSWKMRCTGKDAMEGSGVMTKTATTMDGVMTMKTQGEQMTMKMSGRIVGKCDYAAEQRKNNAMVDDALAKSSEALRKSCEEVRKAASSNLATYDSYKQHADQSPDMRTHLSKCNVNLESSRKQVCAKASFAESKLAQKHCPDEYAAMVKQRCAKATVEDHVFAKKYCPDEYAAMKLQHCTGRSNSFRDLCDGGAGNSAMDTIETGSGNTPTKAILDGAKGLMNVFGF